MYINERECDDDSTNFKSFVSAVAVHLHKNDDEQQQQHQQPLENATKNTN